MRSVLCIVLVVAFHLAASADAGPARKSTGVLCCDQYRRSVLLMDENADWRQESVILWKWAPMESPEVVPKHREWFINLSDAKRVLDGTHIIACASGGGIALVRFEDKRVEFHARAGGNTHSIECLPDGNLVSASSDGSYLRVFCTDPSVSHPPDDVKYSDAALADAHGVVWDYQNQCLWAIGDRELVRFRYNGERVNPLLKEEARFTLPSPGGHDLFPVPGTRKLFLTSGGVFMFDTENETFAPFDQPTSKGAVKSISQREPGGPIVVMESTQSWWSSGIRFVGEDRVLTLDKAKFYKARWWVPNTFSYGPESK